MKLIDNIKKLFQKTPEKIEPLIIEVHDGDSLILTTDRLLRTEQINHIEYAFKTWEESNRKKPLVLDYGLKLQILRKTESIK